MVELSDLFDNEEEFFNKKAKVCFHKATRDRDRQKRLSTLESREAT